MAVESASDRLIFFNTNDFATSATYTVQGGSAATIKGIYDNGFSEVDLGGTVAVSSTDPQFTCRTDDVSSASEGDAIVINSTNYTVRRVEDDGTGVTVLFLETD